MRIAGVHVFRGVNGRGQFEVAVPKILYRLLPSCRTLLRQLGGGLRKRRRCDLLD